MLVLAVVCLVAFAVPVGAQCSNCGPLSDSSVAAIRWGVPNIYGQGAQDIVWPLSIDRVDYEVVNDQPTLLITITNRMMDRLSYSGHLAISDEAGGLVSTHELMSATLPAGISIRIPVYLDAALLDGSYTAELQFFDRNGEMISRAGWPIQVGAAPSSPSLRVPAAIALVVGLILIVASFRVGPVRRRRAPLPEVATIRKVEISNSRAIQPGRIKPLVPPRLRQRE